MRALPQQQKQLQEELTYTPLRLAVRPATYEYLCLVHDNMVWKTLTLTYCKQEEDAALSRQLAGLETEMRALQQQQKQLQDDLDAHSALSLSLQQAKQVPTSMSLPLTPCTGMKDSLLHISTCKPTSTLLCVVKYTYCMRTPV